MIFTVIYIGAEGFDPHDLFGMMFGGGMGRRSKPAGIVVFIYKQVFYIFKTFLFCIF